MPNQETSQAHDLYLNQDFLSGRFSASCSCGWEGSVLVDQRTSAIREWEDHRAG